MGVRKITPFFAEVYNYDPEAAWSNCSIVRPDRMFTSKQFAKYLVDRRVKPDAYEKYMQLKRDQRKTS